MPAFHAVSMHSLTILPFSVPPYVSHPPRDKTETLRPEGPRWRNICAATISSCCCILSGRLQAYHVLGVIFAFDGHFV